MEQLQILTLILTITTIILLLLIIRLTPLVGQVNRTSINIHIDKNT